MSQKSTAKAIFIAICFATDQRKFPLAGPPRATGLSHQIARGDSVVGFAPNPKVPPTYVRKHGKRLYSSVGEKMEDTVPQQALLEK